MRIVQYFVRSKLWDAKHNGTTTFMVDSRSTRNVQYVARSIYNISRSGYLLKFHGMLRLPRKVTLQLHQVLRVAQKMTLMIDLRHT